MLENALYANRHFSYRARAPKAVVTGSNPVVAHTFSITNCWLAHSPIAQRRMALYRGVVSIPFDTTDM
jgi:pyruvate kinase